MGVAMDVLALNLKTGSLSPGVLRKSRETATRRCSAGIGSPVTGKRGKARFLKVVCASSKKKNNDSSSSGNGNQDGIKPAPDWRDFRANLVAREQQFLNQEQQQQQNQDSISQMESTDPSPNQLVDPVHRRPDPKWAHPIQMPETGCFLVATEKIDVVSNFERTVVLLLRLGSQDPRDGPIGVILNRPLDKRVKHLDPNPTNQTLTLAFPDHPLHFGGPLGPLDISMFLLRNEKTNGDLGFEKVVSGIQFGTRNRLNEVAGLVKKGLVGQRDCKFFVGCARWDFDQLLDEIERGYWVVAACSSHLIGCAVSDASGNLWEEVLQLMGGQYAELSRKPRQDGA